MSILPILHYPDDRLRTVASPITEFDKKLFDFIFDLSDTMYHENGIGLAATQVDRHIRVIVVDVSDRRNDLKILVNPELVSASEKRLSNEEGCLSVPNQLIRVPRSEAILVRARNQYGIPFELNATGLLSICIQHEIDHLDGKLIFDHLSLIKKQMYIDSLAKRKSKKFSR